MIGETSKSKGALISSIFIYRFGLMGGADAR